VHALNSIDQFMTRLDDLIRQQGGSGLLMQSHVLLDGRADEAALRTALERLARCYPVVTGRLPAQDGRSEPHWQPGPDSVCPLTITHLDSEEGAHWRYGERLLARTERREETRPVSFHLLRAPDGRDVVLLQWDHRLMDGMAGHLLLREVNRLSHDRRDAGPTAVAASTVPDRVGPASRRSSGDEVSRYVGRHTWRERLRAFLGLRRNLFLLQRSVRLGLPSDPPMASRTVRLVVRSLDEDQTARCLSRGRRLCGFVSPNPVLLASAFRAVQQVSPPSGGWLQRLATQVPINLRPPGADQPLFANLQTYLRLAVPPSALADRDGLVRLLHRQLREQLRRGVDLGFLQMTERMRGRPRQGRLVARGMSRALTFLYGYHGASEAGLDTFCGTPVRNICGGIVTAWSPPGLSFGINQYRGRLNLMVAHVAEVVPESLAASFLDALVEDLLHESPTRVARAAS
jgi:hypothetical protein